MLSSSCWVSVCRFKYSSTEPTTLYKIIANISQATTTKILGFSLRRRAPHFGQDAAEVETRLPHSGQLLSDMAENCIRVGHRCTIGPMQISNRANRGRALESLIEISGKGVVVLEHLPHCGGRWIAKERMVREKICCDFVGMVCGSGIGIFFDAKQDANPDRFQINDAFRGKEHQRNFLVKAGRAGAISGLLIESTATSTLYWLPWDKLRAVSIPWLLFGLDGIVLGKSSMPVNFSRIIGGSQSPA